MTDFLRIYVPTETLKAGDALALYGPDGVGGVDLAAPVARRVAVERPAGTQGAIGVLTGPVELSASGQETAAAAVLVGPLGPGVKKFAARVYDRDTDAAPGGALTEFALFVNAAPRPVQGVASQAAFMSGKLRVTFEESEDL